LNAGASLSWLQKWAPYLAHLPVVAFLFAGALFRGQVLFFRDIPVYYYPNYVFLERSLRQGVWPLWNPTSEAGAPFLITDPLDLLVVGSMGADRALRFGPALHLVLAMSGATWLAAGLGMRWWGAWAAGLFYGLSGYVLSSVNLFELFHASAWGPWVVSAALRMWAAPEPRRVACLALLGAIQVLTLSAETVVQTALFGLALLPGRPDRRRLRGTAAALVLALMLAAPALLGVRALVEDTPRAAGLTSQQSLAFSLRPAVLLDAVLPRFFGDVHTFSDLGYWGQPFFPSGFPYLLSLYCGPALLWLALRSGPGREKTTLLALCGLGVLLSLGSHGPLEWLVTPLMRHFRSPPKFLFMSNLAMCLLAARGLDGASRGAARPPLLALLPGAILAALGPLLLLWPHLPGRLFGGVLPEILDSRAHVVIAGAWPASFGVAGMLFLGAVLALRVRPLLPLAGACVAFDLLIVNQSVNLTTSPAFYELRPAVAELVEKVRGEGTYRWFAYGAHDAKRLRWAPDVARRNADVWLYYVDRQALLPRTHVLDGLEAAYDEDRVGWAPSDSTLPVRERFPSFYRQHHERLRRANVRFVLSFRPLPDDLVRLRGEANLPEMLDPLRLYELRQPLPRAFRVERQETVPSVEQLRRLLEAPHFDPRSVVLLDGAAPSSDADARAGVAPLEGGATFERIDPHTVRLHWTGPPGWLVVLEGYHRDWRAEVNGEPRTVRRANGRYWAIEMTTSDETVTVRYQPAWRPLALSASALGAMGVSALAFAGLQARPSKAPKGGPLATGPGSQLPEGSSNSSAN
jgi:hypothetical protein